jgi:hypothetical protein
VASVYYLRASAVVTSFQGEEDELHLGDELFASGMWLFSAGTALLLLDLRYTVVMVSRARQVEVVGVRQDKAMQVLAVYLLCLVIFGIASTMYILPDETSQTVGVALYVVSNVSFTAISMVALHYLWVEHSDTWAARAAAAAAAGEGGEEDGGDGLPLPSVPEDGGASSPLGLVVLASVDVSTAPEEVPPRSSTAQRRLSQEGFSPRGGGPTSLTAMLLHNMEARQHSPADQSGGGVQASPRWMPPPGTPPTPGSLRLHRSRSVDDTTARPSRQHSQ